MNAVVFHGPGDVRLEELPQPECPPGGLLVEVEGCGVCGTDLKAFRVGNPRINAPQTMGHEFAGMVRETRVTGDSVGSGDRVVMATSVSCGRCFFCRRGWPNLCELVAPMGFSYPGGMAKFVAIPARAVENHHVVRVPENVAAPHATLSEPVSCAINASEKYAVQKGDTVVIIGAGPLGLIHLEVVRAQGAAQVVLVEASDTRMRLTRQFEPDLLLNPAHDDVAKRTREVTGGRGADVVIVAAPSQTAHEQALGLVRKHGTCCLFASLPRGKSELSWDSRMIHYGELTIVASSDSAPRHVVEAVKMLAEGRIRARLLVTHHLPLNEFGRAFDLMERKEGLRIVLQP